MRINKLFFYIVLIIFVLIGYIQITNFTLMLVWLHIETIEFDSDKDQDWLNDLFDYIEWARKEVRNRTNYRSAYYIWWYPPNNEWVCTDVVWRAFKNAWYNLKKLVDTDIKNNTNNYPRVNNNPDPNIDFRRVVNLKVFFDKYATNLTTEIIPWDKDNMKEWQPWDIVIFWEPHTHIAIVSDKRDSSWEPYMIHNGAPVPTEELIIKHRNDNISKIVGHYRYPKLEN